MVQGQDFGCSVPDDRRHSVCVGSGSWGDVQYTDEVQAWQTCCIPAVFAFSAAPPPHFTASAHACPLFLLPLLLPLLPSHSWQQAHCVDEHSRPLQSDLYGAPLTFSGKQHDTMALGTIRVAYT